MDPTSSVCVHAHTGQKIPKRDPLERERLSKRGRRMLEHRRSERGRGALRVEGYTQEEAGRSGRGRDSLSIHTQSYHFEILSIENKLPTCYIPSHQSSKFTVHNENYTLKVCKSKEWLELST